ncbi:ribosomal protein L14 (apicoplast) [Toxoplasma gondii RH]|uniref:Large ribosomal subunit protein uL14c n=6 Tax=Toxoplasma gondii TaxID=5811 RepID=RK14_TOXGO|nr:ribosomal protein L14 [Toxoplasma gondii RH]Q9XQQ6.1 RecName: Full=Large ribosomal subunit protein uL14c; AltName: Full=50S ribosomal protein L14, apicoplast [Toxoplasma gondii]KFG99167.1 ribosomal protein L14 [Toxoplasma gondii MAS]KYF38387.1 ribosomal protein L14 [Toxoplasma gondii ARI]PIL95820.1 ribosomal protein L14 [Toxoplasma gondii COUG]PUA92989.1 ribosomal protein L14 [Toxoplasma gondii TgCATBr9]AAD41139.1 ribosomal protein L14 [Toxoplasma gondii]|eukprot:NP_044552.1 ribosomal protein L14 (apicoplast) [Toxoplasma gondii RH]
MTQLNSFFYVSDNTGVKKIFSIQNITRNSFLVNTTDIILGIIKEISFKSSFKYSEIVYGFVVRLKKTQNIQNRYNYIFNENAVILIDKNFNPLGTRIFGLFPENLKNNNYLKLNSLVLNII